MKFIPSFQFRSTPSLSFTRPLDLARQFKLSKLFSEDLNKFLLEIKKIDPRLTLTYNICATPFVDADKGVNDQFLYCGNLIVYRTDELMRARCRVRDQYTGNGNVEFGMHREIAFINPSVCINDILYKLYETTISNCTIDNLIDRIRQICMED